MKKKFKAFISCLLAVLMLVPTTVAFAATPTSENEQLAKNIVAIEDELAANDTDVVTELSDMIAEYKAMLNNPDENIDVDNVQSLISTLEEMLDEYQMYKAGVSTYKFHVIYSPAVAAVVAYFKVQGYSLAAELLTHAKDDTKLNSNYYPTNGSRVRQSSVFKSIASGTKTSGSGEFKNSGTTVDKDLYYAIHFFNFTKSSASSRTVTIRDRYDFAPGDYSDIAGIAVDTMYKAQQAGVIIPYYVNITATL